VEIVTLKPKISVIIPTKNRSSEVIDCLNSIATQKLLPNEVLVIDSSDTKILKNKLNEKKINSIEITYINIRSSLAEARNIGAEHSLGDIIMFLDDDVVLDADYIKQIIDVFNMIPDKKIGGVTGKVKIRGKDKIFKYARFYNIYAILFFLRRYGNGRFLPSGMQTYIRPNFNKIIECEYLHGCNMTFLKKVFIEFKADNNFSGYSVGEDADISYRVSKKYKNIFTPYAKLIHNKSQSARSNNHTLARMEIINAYYLFKKNFPQDFRHRFAFWWSIVGVLFLEVIRSNLDRDDARLKGTITGINRILFSPRNKNMLSLPYLQDLNI